MVEKDSKLVFVIGEGDVNQVKSFQPFSVLELASFLQYRVLIFHHTSLLTNRL